MKAVDRNSNFLRWAATLLTAALVALSPAGPSAVAAPTPRPDLVVTDLKLSEADGGAKLDIQFKVKNQGTADAKSVLVGIYIGPNTQQTRQIDKLDAGKSKGFELKVDYPTYQNPQERTVRVFADPNDTIAEVDENNNQAIAYFDLSSATLPDLVIDRVDIEQTKLAPPEVTVTVHVMNKGKGDASSFWVAAWQPENPGYTDSFLLSAGLKSGQSHDFQFVSVPVHLDPCTFIAEVDQANTVKESNEGNNRGSGHLKIKIDSKLPDLAVQKVRIVRSGEILLTFEVHNDGGSDSPGPITVTVRHDQNEFSDDFTIPGGLKKGESVAHDKVFIPSNADDAAGTHLVIDVYPAAGAPDSNPTNNIATVTIPGTKKLLNPVMPVAPSKP
jgi:subtilase family serine protease